MKCPRCQQDNPSHAKFCLECGVPFSDKNGPSPGSYTDLQRALAEALEQQTATEEILRVISRSPTDLQPVLDTIARSAVSVCGATDALVSIREGDESVTAAHYGDQEVVALGQRRPIIRGLVVGRALLEARPVQVEDITQTDEFPEGRAIAIRMGHRTVMAVPLLRNGVAIGGILMRRSAVKPFTDKQISLLKTFADQAVIAIENVRLFNETKEALERQTATSEILRVISSSPTDVQPVFDAIAQSASRLCGAFDASIFRVDGDRLAFVAHHGPIAQRHGDFSLPLVRGTVGGRSVLESRTVQVADLQNEDREFPDAVENARRFGFRTILSVPLLREGIAIGGIQLRRTQVQLFSERQIALLQTFADQAVIAIENVRLFTELQEKNRALTQAHAQVTESLEQQTATAEILRLIGTSPTDAQPVFEGIARSGVQVLGALGCAVFVVEGDTERVVATHNVRRERVERFRTQYPAPFSSNPEFVTTVRESIFHLADIEHNPDATPEQVEFAQLAGYRTRLMAPMMRGDSVLGIVAVTREAPTPFPARQVELLKTFADQAVIAIENVRLFNELEARNRDLIATSEILQVISRSPTDAQPVFDTIAQRAKRLCDARECGVFRFDGALIHLTALADITTEWAQALRSAFPRPPGRGSMTARAIETRSVVHVPDVLADFEFDLTEAARRSSIRSVLSVPMLRHGEVIGAITVDRHQPEPFTEKQISLLQTFADQAVIAIENVRLFKELEARNRDLTETLQQQTATSEILRVISQSPTDVQPVFDTIVRSAARLLDAHTALVMRLVGDELHLAALTSTTDVGAEAAEAAVRKNFPTPLALAHVPTHVVQTRRAYIVSDVEADPVVGDHIRMTARLRGYRSMLHVPMMREGRVIGLIVVTRRLPGTFSDSEVTLLETFADQSVIAIENVRLFTELQDKNRALTQAHERVTEALEQQTATGEILKTIAQAQTDVQPVFDTIVRNAARLCHATHAAVFVTDGRMVYNPANYGSVPEALAAASARFPWPVGTDTTAGMAILTRSVVHMPDSEDPSALEIVRQVGPVLGFRSLVTVPMLRESEAVGAILVARREVGRFSDAEVDLLRTFADQAVIAIENARLFRELEARTAALSRSVERLTALGEVGRAVSSTLDLETVLTTIVSRAVQLSGLDAGVVFEYDEGAGEFLPRAATESGGALAEARRTTRIRKGEGALGQTAITLEPAQVPDITVPGAHESRLREILIESGVRAVLAVPMVREGRLIGCLGVTRNRPGDFPSDTIDLLRTFATQSALAIQNARLFQEIEDKSRQLEAASQHKSEFLANMSHELRTPLNAIIGFSEVLSERMFGDLNEKQEEYLKDIHASGQHLLSLINDILDLSKIEAGRMELELAEFHLPQAIENALVLVRERALRRGITLEQSIDQRLGEIRGDERKIKQVLLNLLSNAIKFTPEGGRIEVRAKPVIGSVEVSVSDTGVGIAPEDQEAIFEEFRQVGTAARKVEGTGLGLALSRKFVEMHGGRIWVRSQLGGGSTFSFTIPVRTGA
jgi:GAF domain-containing protein